MGFGSSLASIGARMRWKVTVMDLRLPLKLATAAGFSFVVRCTVLDTFPPLHDAAMAGAAGADGSPGVEPCDGAAANACQGCGVLIGVPGASCQICGKYVCGVDNASVSCQEPVPNDPKHCGTCNHDCTALPHVAASSASITCSASKCIVPPSACEPGFAHCSANPDDGCEADLRQPQHCQSCSAVCLPTQTCTVASCLLADEQPCTVASDCANGVCVVGCGVDADGDGFGDKTGGTFAFCTRPPTGYAPNRLDCCDRDPDANPDQTAYSEKQTTCGGYDWNCNGIEEPEFLNRSSCPPPMDGWQSAIAPCGMFGDWVHITMLDCSAAQLAQQLQLCR